ncbi:MAG: A24 family peptidase [Pseudomonadota bacterium]
MTEAIWWPVALGVLGAVFGSFIATVAIRWPAGRSALIGRSACDGCGQTLSPLELVPLVSGIALRGRCRSCGGRIGLSHPATELLGLGIGVVAGLVAPGWTAVAGAVFGWLLLAAGAVDLAAFRLPNAVTLTLAVSGVFTGAIGVPPPVFDRAIGGVLGFGALWMVAAVYRMVRGRIGLGGGDAKLFGAIGLWLGWRALPPTLLIACLLGLGVVLVMVLSGRKVAATDRLPLGSLLAVGAFAMWIFAAS